MFVEGRRFQMGRVYDEALAGRRVSRRTVLRGGLVGGVGLTAFALACSSKNNGTKSSANNVSSSAGGATTRAAGTAAPAGAATATAAGSPAAGNVYNPVPGKAGGDYRAGFTGPFAGVDPHNSVYGGSGIVPIVYSYLVRTSVIAPDKGILPELATKWEQPDPATTIFTMRNDAMIAENSLGVPVRPIDADDVVASFQRIADPKSGANGYLWIKDWQPKFEAVDKTTVRVTTKGPYAWVLNQIGNNLQSAIVPREWLASPDIKRNAVGSGPFILQSLQEGGQAVMNKNPNYFEKGLPYVNSVNLKAFADQATYRTAFSSNQLDVYSATNVDEAKELEKAGKNVQRFEDPSFGFNSFWMNVAQKPWDDPRIRRAVRRAVNPDEYIQIVAHGLGKQIGPITYAMVGYTLPDDELKKLMPYNPQEAKQLLQAAGQSNLTLKFQHPTSSNVTDYVNIFVRQMQAAGINVQPEPQDAGTWVAAYFTNKLTASLSLNQEYANPDVAMHWFTTGGITGNNHYDTGFTDPEVDAAVAKAAGTIDEAARKQAYLDAQRLVIGKDAPFWNFYGAYANVVAAPELMNYPRGLGSLGYYYTKNLWFNR
jgi:peptide/nickel transport system substrate-binding protein